MLKKHAQFFESLFFISDVLLLSLAWVLSYLLGFQTGSFEDRVSLVLLLLHYIETLFPLWLIWMLVSKGIHLYHTRRMEHFFKEILDIIRALTIVTLMMMAIVYLLRRFDFSRLVFLYFWLLGVFGLVLWRYTSRRLLKGLRKKGFNLRFAVIAGTGDLGRKILNRIETHPELGIQVTGLLTHEAREVGTKIKNVPVIGLYEDLNKAFEMRPIDIFFVALSIGEYDRLGRILENLQGHSSDIKVIPGAYEFIGLRGGVDELDDLPMISLQSSPLYGWNMVFKRGIDLFLGTIALVVLSPVMFFISLMIKCTSKGPIFYKQERIGIDGQPFQMLKFRTMRPDAEKETGPVWVKENDLRRTKLGGFLRKSSLDELPQLVNVLKGEMSLVGPRPERPNFVEEFKGKIPSYILRHKIKAGMTGWAQVNGWRGNTSLERRIEHDLYYIQNWSISFDLLILLMTLWKGFFSKSAY